VPGRVPTPELWPGPGFASCENHRALRRNHAAYVGIAAVIHHAFTFGPKGRGAHTLRPLQRDQGRSQRRLGARLRGRVLPPQSRVSKEGGAHEPQMQRKA
jgi:hypothetical protein